MSETDTLIPRRTWPLVWVGVGVMTVALGLLLIFVVPPVTDARSMGRWIETRATLDAVSERIDSEGRSRVNVSYRFTVDGEDFRGTRASLHGGSDNIGNFQALLANRLQRARDNDEPVTAWFDPDDPTRSVLDRTLRPGVLALSGVISLVFGLIGALLAIFGLQKKIVVKKAPANPDQPWRQRQGWNGQPIQSNAQNASRVLIAFAAFWNLISWPMLMLLPDVVREEGFTAAAVLLIFPLIGIAVAIFAWRVARDWRRHGATPMTLSPYPGVLGGQVAGSIALSRSTPPATRMTVTLTASRHSRRGKRTHEKVLGQWSQNVVSEAGLETQIARFNLDAPPDFDSSDAAFGRTRNAWYLSFEAPDIGLSRRFEVPIYPDTGHHQGRARRVDALDTHTPGALDWTRALPMKNTGSTRTLDWRYGLLENKLGVLLFTAIGLMFFAVSVQFAKESLFIAILFGAFSGLLSMLGIAALGSSKRVLCTRERLIARTWWIGFPIRRHQFQLAEVDKYSLKLRGRKSKVSGPVELYEIVAHTEKHKKVVIAWNVESKEAAQAVVAGLKEFQTQT